MHATRVTRYIGAPRDTVYQALIDADAIGRWRVPDGMTGHVHELEFETPDPAMRGIMTMTTTLTDAGDGTEVTIEHHGIPDAVTPTDNEAGTRMALDALDRLLSGRRPV
ncbi:SRPBCC domain-containing protein [Actinoplanes sp. NPDC023801]|uniref:SRPBCC domain-containing protein n=1 Tax=Actinoplanes sp. NPDC023801 TaxID=3154595 RepID=UPI003408E731